MVEPKQQEQAPTTPYDLWPDEIVPFPEADRETDRQDEIGAIDATPTPANWAARENFDKPFEVPFIPVAYTPETVEQTVRNSGLAWSAGVAFFGAVVFMLFLGWLADQLLGSSPWGIVVGIILGAIIGFIQFFRISSQIYAARTATPEHRPLLTRDEDPD